MAPTTTAQATGGAPLALKAGEGEARWFFGTLATIKLTAAQTRGEMTVLEVLAPAGLSAPLHVHYAEDETFWILEGEVSFEVGEERIVAGPGDCVFGPRDIPHRFDVGDRPARMIWILTPGGFDEFVLAASEPAEELAPPPPVPAEEMPALLERLAPIVRAHGNELLI
jgi:mannose-6-phosphate isomerase-like protein (cupin superfamily)